MIGSAGEISRYQLSPPVWKSSFDLLRIIGTRRPGRASRAAALEPSSRLFQGEDRPHADRLRHVCALEHPLRLLRPPRFFQARHFARRAGPRPTVREPGQPQGLTSPASLLVILILIDSEAGLGLRLGHRFGECEPPAKPTAVQAAPNLVTEPTFQLQFAVSSVT